MGPAWPAGRRQAGWRRLTDRATDLEEGAVEPSGVGRDALHNGVKAFQLQALVKRTRANLKYLL